MGLPQTPQTELTIFPSTTITTTTNGSDFSDISNAGGIFFLNVTAASGTTPTLDVKIQAKSQVTGQYIDIPGASFTQKTAAGFDMLVVTVGVTPAANKAVSHPLPAFLRPVFTVGGTTPSFTVQMTYQPAE